MFTNEEKNKILKLILINGIQYNGQASSSAVLKVIGREYAELRPRIKDLTPDINHLVDEWNQKSLDEFKMKLKELDPDALTNIEKEKDEKLKGQESKKEKKAIEYTLSPLPNAKENEVVLRLAPYPSGSIHYGNARMIILNSYYAQRYKGKLFLVYDDTIGSADKTIDPESYDLILKALNFLGITLDGIYYKSDRLEIYYEYAEKLIKMDKMYICTCPGDEWRGKNKIPGIACIHRSNSIDTNLEQWQKMLNGSFAMGEAVARLKTGMDQKDPALRDQIALRISDHIHPRVGNKYRIWPLLDYSWGLDDHLLGMTHIIRGIDLQKEGFIEQIIWDWFGWKHPEIILFGRVKAEGFSFSKSRDAKLVRSHTYGGWDDPRTWSVQSLQRRGYSVKAIWNSILALGTGPNTVRISPANLYHENRVLVDDITPRLFAIENPISVYIEDVSPQKLSFSDVSNMNLPVPGVRITTSQKISKNILNHPTNVNLGKHEIKIGKIVKNKLELLIEKSDIQLLKKEKYARLLHLFNIEFVSEDSNGIHVKYAPNQDQNFIKERNAPFIQWLPKTSNLYVDLTLENGSKTKIYVEEHLKDFKKGQLVQLIRKEFVSVDDEKDHSLIFAHL